ncbi:MAG: hypothetical protein ACM35F_04125, partial [Betaproteobacteria bacterium]
MARKDRDEALQVPASDWEILRDFRAYFLKQVGQLLKESGPLPDDARSAFVSAVGDYFDDKVVIGKRTTFAQTAELNASNIALVGEADLEFEIRVGEFVSRLVDNNSDELWRLYLRFVTLLDRPDLSAADNPVGPRGFAKGVAALSGMLGEDHARKLDR